VNVASLERKRVYTLSVYWICALS